ncbi:MAG TPA: MarR family transcriptional regulator [Solirubrobacteraceae bacterium]|jgi:DNA-binding MarR family transcriptional regulator
MRHSGDPRVEAWTLMQELMLGQKGRMFAIAGEFELAPAQVMALGRLEPGRPCAMSELAGALRCDNSNVTGIADRLEARGLVERRAAEHDRRLKMLHLTDQGAELRERLWERLSRPPEPLAGLSEEDAAALRDVLRRALRPEGD